MGELLSKARISPAQATSKLQRQLSEVTAVCDLQQKTLTYSSRDIYMSYSGQSKLSSSIQISTSPQATAGATEIYGPPLFRYSSQQMPRDKWAPRAACPPGPEAYLPLGQTMFQRLRIAGRVLPGNLRKIHWGD